MRSHQDKNSMPLPSQPPIAGEPLLNLVIQPQNQQSPQERPQPVQAEPRLLQMSTAERIVVNNILNEFRRVYENNFAPQLATIQSLDTSIFWILREIDGMRMMGQSITNMHDEKNCMRHLAAAGARQENQIQPFESLAFEIQMFFMNLSYFTVRYLQRIG